jgi:hypothetical protein
MEHRHVTTRIALESDESFPNAVTRARSAVKKIVFRNPASEGYTPPPAGDAKAALTSRARVGSYLFHLPIVGNTALFLFYRRQKISKLCGFSAIQTRLTFANNLITPSGSRASVMLYAVWWLNLGAAFAALRQLKKYVLFFFVDRRVSSR